MELIKSRLKVVYIKRKNKAEPTAEGLYLGVAFAGRTVAQSAQEGGGGQEGRSEVSALRQRTCKH